MGRVESLRPVARGTVRSDLLEDRLLIRVAERPGELRDRVLIEAHDPGRSFQPPERVGQREGAAPISLACPPFPLEETPCHLGAKGAPVAGRRVHPVGQSRPDLRVHVLDGGEETNVRVQPIVHHALEELAHPGRDGSRSSASLEPSR